MSTATKIWGSATTASASSPGSRPYREVFWDSTKVSEVTTRVYAMIVFRGWGALGLFIPLLVVGAVFGLMTVVTSSTQVQGIGVAVGSILGGVAGYYAGIWFNKKRPQQKVEQWEKQRLAELIAAVDAGKFQMRPGMPAPSSPAEGYAQAAELVKEEREGLLERAQNIHSLFWIPMQWVAVVVGVAIFSGSFQMILS